ncbi:hypothetical protein EIP91_010775 [Steccherinum ochraceum]|uniref:RING-type domain-containing protein n=1 Tax=Steccherinum ochraceum TaxID=92696 RepID=A0A4R0R086_9APHY|nr:hypothetical protein EIP91_010775 [Steccherinum ochraceum]
MPLPASNARRTRSGSRVPQPHRPLRPQPSNNEDDIIVISSDSDDERPAKMIPKKRSAHPRPAPKSKEKAKANARSPVSGRPSRLDVHSEDEDEDDGGKRRSSRTVEEMEKQIQKLKVENKQLKQQQLSMGSQSKGESSRSKAAEDKRKALLTTLDEGLSCDICAGKMWQPATLACGHTFCQGCLQDWFSTALMKHLNTYPTYTLQTPRVRQIFHTIKSRHIAPYQRRILELDALAELEKSPQPEYSCPSCRVAVKNRPSEVFALKSTIRTVAAELEEPEPEGVQGRGKHAGPWDGFFLNFSA